MSLINKLELVDQIVIDSKDKETSSAGTTDFTIKIPLPTRKITHMMLTSVILPLVYNNVTTDNYAFTVAGTGYNFSLGHYGIDALVAEGNDQMSGSGYTFSWTNQSRLKISGAGAFAFIPGDAAELLGFDDTTYSGAASYTAPYYPNLVQNREYITLHSRTLSKLSVDETSHTDSRSDIICAIPIEKDHGSMQSWTPDETKIYAVKNSYINYIDFKVKDANNVTLDIDNFNIIIILNRYIKHGLQVK